MLRRAGNAPLTLNLYAFNILRKDRPSDLVVAFLIRNKSTLIPRIRELNLVNILSGLDSRIFQYKYPQLDTLRIYSGERADMSGTLKAPALRKARFTNTIPAIISSVLCDVTIDRTDTDSIVPQFDVGIRHQQNFLRTFATSLVRLRMINILIDDSLISGQSWETQIPLPEMRHLHIASTSASDAFPLLGGVILPETALLSLDIDFRNYNDGDKLRSDLSALLSAARINELSPTGIAISDMNRYHGDKTHRLEIELYTTPAIAFAHMDPAYGPFAGQTHRVSLRSNYESDTTEWSLNTFLDALASCTLLETVNTLSYQGCCDVCAPSVDPTLLARFPDVRTMHLADAHSRCSRVMESLCGTSPALPGLECLWLTQRSNGHVLQREKLAEQLQRRCDALRNEVSEGATRLKRLRVDGTVGLGESEDSQKAQISLKSVVDHQGNPPLLRRA